ncbi:MAG TPA: hypothetical protein VJZ00_12600, partial [Thermoanaerobaculia bacterium]|nr:hypothetical protein [Thermoanaerobaculia bacterium]
AAGETPSPEMVAAAAETGAISRRLAMAMFASIVIGLIAISWQAQSRLISTLRKPPEVFIDRAEEIAKHAGETAQMRDEVHWFVFDRSTKPGTLRFVSRRAPSRMTPRESVQPSNDVFIFQTGRVTMTDPPLVPGASVIVLDAKGALVEYRAFSTGGAAGASLATPDRGTTTRNSSSTFVSQTIELVLMLVTTVAAIVAARRSLRRGRGDRVGALRVAVYAGVCLFVAWFVAAHHATDPQEEARLLSGGLGQACASALVLWLFYIALEPGVRRLWPRSLIGWTRLLAGRFRDAMVARELLFGIALGILAHEVFWISTMIRLRAGTIGGFFASVDGVQPLSIFLGDQLVSHVQAIEIPIGIAFTLLLARKAFSKIGGYLALSLFFVAYGMFLPATGIYLALVLVAIVRSGLLTGVATGVTLSLLAGTPLTLDTDAWYWPRALVVLLLVAAAAAWTARDAARHQPSFST